MWHKKYTITLCVCFFALSCAHMYSEKDAPSSNENAITMGPGDIFNFAISGEENTSQEIRININGHATLPLIGTMFVSGMDIDTLRNALTEKYKEFIINPYIIISIKELHSKKIFITGEVKTPGPIPFTEGISIIQAISNAGGLAEYASKKVVINRKKGNSKERISVSLKDIEQGNAPNLPLMPDDIVYVPQSFF